MFRITAKVEYACLAMLALAARHESGEPVRIREIADSFQIPQRFLVQILLQLKTAGLVSSTRGASGGYQLMRRPDQISLFEVIERIAGPAEQSEAGTLEEQLPGLEVLHEVWEEFSSTQEKILKRITLADLTERMADRSQNMYYI
ncbi:HTH-type transcriptional regulator CymR [Planctomycetales bacterium 10988]|nr:HTH-type transcriptional regulator CymR [Planctomycetales bacterium 10988]